MHRAALGALSLVLAGCTSSIPQIKPAPLKPIAAAPVKPQPKPVAANTSVAPVIVTGPDDAENKRIALAMFHGLNLAGHDIKPNGAWKVQGRVHEGFITWTIISPDGSTAGTVAQRGITDPAIAAVVPGVRSYLPRPSTNL